MLNFKNKKIFIADDGFEKSYIQLDNSSVEKNPYTRAVILFYYGEELDTAPPDFIERLELSGCCVFFLNFSIDELFKVKSKNISWILRQGYIFQQFVEHINKEYGIESQDISIISFAISSLVIAAWIIDYATKVSSVVLFSPDFFATRKEIIRLGIFKITNSGNRNKKIIDSKGLSYKNKISLCDLNAWRKINDLLSSSRRIIRDAFSYQTPTLFVFSEKELAEISPSQRKFYDNIASEIKEIFILSFPEKNGDSTENKSVFYNRIKEFIFERFSDRYTPASLFNLYLNGVSKDEYEKLRLDEKKFLKIIYWEVVKKLFIRWGGCPPV